MATKTKLSSALLQMKFMKRTHDKVVKEEEDAAGRAMYSNEITSKMLHGDERIIIEPSYVQCENLLEGRFSFRGMNPEIERILELEEAAKQQTQYKDVKKDVSDQDMATYYSNLAKTVAKKYEKSNRRKMNLPEPVNDSPFNNSNQQQPQKKPRYMKPNPDDDE